MKNIYCCKKILKTAYCPYCGKSMEEIARMSAIVVFPFTFNVWVFGLDTGDKECALEKAGIILNSKLGKELWECDNGIKLTYEITGNGKKDTVKLVAVNDKPMEKI